MKCPVVSFGLYGFRMALEAHFLMLKIVFHFCLRVIMECLAVEFSDSWVEKHLGELCLLIFPIVRSPLMF